MSAATWMYRGTRLRSYAFKSLDMVGAIRWFGRERDAFHAMQASQYRARARQRAETRPWSAAIDASNGTCARSLVSSGKLFQQSRERLLHAGGNDGAVQRARGYRGRRRYGDLAARRPGVARADGAEPPWRDRGGRKRAGATLLQYAADGTHDADISGAATQVAAELEADAPLVGVGKARDDVARRDQHCRRAESALQTMLGHECPPQRDHDRVVLQSFDRRDLRALAQDRIGDARPRRLAVDQQRARTARALLAAKMRAGQTEPFAQQVGEVHARLYGLDDRDGVDGEPDGFHWAIAWAAARARAVMWRRAGVVRPARSSRSLAALSSRRTAAPGCGIPPHIARASSTTTGRPCVAPMTALKQSRSPSSNTAPLASANSPALRHTL